MDENLKLDPIVEKMISVAGPVSIDLNDIRPILDDGEIVTAEASASGDCCIVNALEILDKNHNIYDARKIAIQIYTNLPEKYPIQNLFDQLNSLNDRIGPDTFIIWGLSIDKSLDDDVKVAVVASGLK